MMALLRAFLRVGLDHTPGEVTALLIGLGTVIAIVHLFGPG